MKEKKEMKTAYREMLGRLEKRYPHTGGLYAGVDALALIMFETEFPIFQGWEEEPDPHDFSPTDHEVHDMRNNWPYFLVRSMSLQQFAKHILMVSLDNKPFGCHIEELIEISYFVDNGAEFVVDGRTFKTVSNGELIDEFYMGDWLPFNYATIQSAGITTSWGTINELVNLVDELSRHDQMKFVTRNTSMDELFKRKEV